jgi:hypothetical protein
LEDSSLARSPFFLIRLPMKAPNTCDVQLTEVVERTKGASVLVLIYQQANIFDQFATE